MIRPKHLKNLPAVLTETLNAKFQVNGKLARSCCHTKRNDHDIGNYRPIELTRVIPNLIERVLKEQPREQAGLRKRFSPRDHIYTTTIFKLNLNKMMLMKSEYVFIAPFTLNGKNISECSSYVYLGHKINMMNDEALELSRRERAA
ncbi:hypothetical protein DICVIV_11247 [Dictyocaulus viviparus]|uniref:Uncharacterized protein n=1 Tax=Dictyocaulus viviparus TaxID=29172 RepID=A0A0D8XKC2_DICVI|nr:hypothetical protein DICVIV_11247 [Dictyocaulus viviparus]